MVLVSAPSSSIGLVKSTGEFRVDGSAVRGNGNIFEGNVVETGASRSIIQLADVQITLAPNSCARVFSDHTVLERGSSSVKDGAHHVIEADSLRIAPASQDSIVRIEITSPSRLVVASMGGPADVRNSSGLLAAHVLPGMSLAFDPQAAAASAVKMTGILEVRDGIYFLTDETSKVKVQIDSADAAKYVGKKVQIVGSSIPDAKPLGGASQLVHVVTIETVGKTVAAAGAGAGGSARMSGLTLGAIVGGVAVAGTVGGLAAAGTFSSSSSISRP